MKPVHRLLVISSGSWETSILGRNALGRVLAGSVEGLFDEVDYVFFPTEVRGYHEPAYGLRVHEIPGRPDLEQEAGWGSRWRGLREGWAEIEAIAEERPPSIVNAAEPFLSGMIARALARKRRVPTVMTLVSDYQLSWKFGRLNPMPFAPAPVSFAVERWALRGADRVHVDCAYYAECAARRGADPSRIRRIPRYADPAYYEATPDPEIWKKLGIPDDRPLVYVGRLSPEKYAMRLAETFLSILDQQPEKRLVVVGGGGPDQEPFLERIRSAGEADKVVILSGLACEEILSVLAAAGVVLATHAGYALLEAALAGAAVVAYDYEWHPELIEDGETGRLVPYRDAEAMAAAALELLAAPARAREMGRALRSAAESGYRVDDHVAALRMSYEELLQDSGA